MNFDRIRTRTDGGGSEEGSSDGWTTSRYSGEKRALIKMVSESIAIPQATLTYSSPY